MTKNVHPRRASNGHPPQLEAYASVSTNEKKEVVFATNLRERRRVFLARFPVFFLATQRSNARTSDDASTRTACNLHTHLSIRPSCQLACATRTLRKAGLPPLASRVDVTRWLSTF